MFARVTAPFVSTTSIIVVKSRLEIFWDWLTTFSWKVAIKQVIVFITNESVNLAQVMKLRQAKNELERKAQDQEEELDEQAATIQQLEQVTICSLIPTFARTWIIIIASAKEVIISSALVCLFVC